MTTSPEIDLEDWNTGEDAWCILDDENPGFSLCGMAAEGATGPVVPNSEVPEEITCQHCLEISRKQDL